MWSTGYPWTRRYLWSSCIGNKRPEIGDLSVLHAGLPGMASASESTTAICVSMPTATQGDLGWAPAKK